MSKKSVIEILLKGKDAFSPVLGRAKKGISSFVGGSIAKLGALKNSLFSLSNVMIGAFTGMAAKLIFTPAIKMEMFNTQWAVLLGGLDQAKARMSELTDFAASTPFELAGVQQASRTLEVLTHGALSTGKGLRMVGDVAAGTSQPIGELSVWFGRLYDGIQSGRPVGEAMARLQELGVVSGETRGKIEELMKSGADSDKTWQVLTDSVGKFDGMMAKMSETSGGKMSTLKDNFNLALGDISTEMLPMLNKAMDDLLVTIDDLRKSGDLKKWGQQAGEAMESIIASIKAAARFIKNNQEALKTLGFTTAGIYMIYKVTKGFLSARNAVLAWQTAANATAAASALNKSARETAKLAGASAKLMSVLGKGLILVAVGLAAYKFGQYLSSITPAAKAATAELRALNKQAAKMEINFAKHQKKFSGVNKNQLNKLYANAGSTDSEKMGDEQQKRLKMLKNVMSEADFNTVTLKVKTDLAEKQVNDFFKRTKDNALGAKASELKVGGDQKTNKAAAFLGADKVAAMAKTFDAKQDYKSEGVQRKQEAEFNKTHLSGAELKGLDKSLITKKKKEAIAIKVKFEMKAIAVKLQKGTKLDDREESILAHYQAQMAKKKTAEIATEKKSREQAGQAQGARKQLADYQRELKIKLQVDGLATLVAALEASKDATANLEKTLANEKNKLAGAKDDAGKSNAQLKDEERSRKKQARKDARKERKVMAKAERAAEKMKNGETLTKSEQKAYEYALKKNKTKVLEKKIAREKRKEERAKKKIDANKKKIDAQKKRKPKGITSKDINDKLVEVNQVSEVTKGKTDDVSVNNQKVMNTSLNDILTVLNELSESTTLKDIKEAIPTDLFALIKGD